MARASLKKAKLGPKDCGSGEPHGKQKKTSLTLKYLKQIVCACPARCWPPWKLKLLTVPEGEPERNCVQPEGARWAESQPSFKLERSFFRRGNDLK